MVNSIASAVLPATHVATSSKPAQAGAAQPRRAPFDRFLVAVPDDAQQADLASRTPFVATRPHDARKFELTTAGTLASVVECLKRTRAVLELSVGGRKVAASIVAARGQDILVRLDGRVGSGPYSARCDVYDVPFMLRGQLLVAEPDTAGGEAEMGAECHALLSKPRIYVLDERRETRICLSQGVGTLRWARIVDGVPRIVHSPIVDLAPDGASIRLGAEDPVPPSEPFVGELQLGNVKLPLLASLRRHVDGDQFAIAGLSLDTGSGKRRLVDAYMRSRLPGLVPRADIPREQVADLLGESGYLDLRAGEGPSQAWHQYQSAHSLDVAYRAQDGKLIGHVSVTRSYKRTWTMHQLATLSGHAESGTSRRILYDFVCSAPLALDGEQACSLAYFNPKRRWHQLFIERFMQWLNDDGLGTVVSFDRFERDPEAAPAAALALEPGHEVVPLGEDDVLPAVALIRSQLPPLLSEALNINPDDLQSSTLNGSTERGRTAFALRANGTLLGVALCETGSASASLFNIFNMAQFYVCIGAAKPSVSAQLALLAAVRGYYARRGSSSPLIIAPAGSFAGDQEAGTVLAESMGCFVVGGGGLRQWEHYCRLAMGQLYQRKAPSRRRQEPQENRHVAVAG